MGTTMQRRASALQGLMIPEEEEALVTEEDAPLTEGDAPQASPMKKAPLKQKSRLSLVLEGARVSALNSQALEKTLEHLHKDLDLHTHMGESSPGIKAAPPPPPAKADSVIDDAIE